MAISKFMPEIAVFDGHPVAILNGIPTSQGIEQGKMAGKWVMKASHQSVNHLHPPLWVNKETDKAASRADFAPIPSRFERPHNGGADGNHAMTG